MRKWRLGVTVFALLVVVQGALVPILDRRSDDVTRSWRTDPLPGLRDGVRVVQTFDIGYHGLAGIELPATLPPSPTPRYVDARLWGPDGTTTVMRRTTVTIAPGQIGCCRLTFDRIPASGRRFQLELRFRGFTPEHDLALTISRVRIQGGLRVNGRPLRGNLTMNPDGDIEHLPGALRIPLAALAAALALIDALAAAAVQVLARRAD